MLAALGVGLIAQEAAQGGWVTLVERAQPDAARMAFIPNSAYRRSTDLYPALKP